MNLNAEPEDFDLNSEDPIYIFAGLSLKEMKNLKQDIRMHMELDTENEQHREFWEAMLIVCEAEEAEATQQEARDKARLRGEDTSSIGYEAGLHASVDDDIKAMFQGKVFAELLVCNYLPSILMNTVALRDPHKYVHTPRHIHASVYTHSELRTRTRLCLNTL